MTLRAFAVQLIAFLSIAVAMPASAGTHDAVQTTWRLLDYIAVDYTEAVSDGEVTNELEYAEMQEFSASVAELYSFKGIKRGIGPADRFSSKVFHRQSNDTVLPMPPSPKRTAWGFGAVQIFPTTSSRARLCFEVGRELS